MEACYLLDIIRNKREKLGLKQKEFAKFLAEKESIIHKLAAASIWGKGNSSFT